MLLGGLWHGSAWTFLLWGLYHGTLLIVHRLCRPLLERYSRPILAGGVDVGRLIRMFVMFQFTCVGWLIFRAQSIDQIVGMSEVLLTNFFVSLPAIDLALSLVYFIAVLLPVQVVQYRTNDLYYFSQLKPTQKVSFALTCSFLVLYVLVLGRNANIGGGNEFIYFQF
jgi:D-alanyl-lipoteichoic acid acyltransferase DltB (MBOAT superfamily)